MKSSANIFRNLAMALLPMVVAGLSPLATAQIVPSVGTNVVQSVFVLPDSPKEGRDPFFPSSLRPYRDRPNPGGAAELSDLKLEGVTRSHGNVFVIINDVTFGVGDDADVETPTGAKVHILCVRINTDSVVVEADGQDLTLTLLNP
jgi:hypothetical protein